MNKLSKNKLYMSEIFKRISLQPLLIPAVILYVSIFVILSFKPVNNINGDMSHYSELTVVQSNVKLNGKTEYIAKVEGERVLLRCEETLYPGDKIVCNYSVSKPKEPTNPGQFDYSEYLSKKGITKILNVNQIDSVVRNKLGHFLTMSRYFIRDSVYSWMNSSLNSEQSAILAALCLGDSSLASDGTIRCFRVLNCSHVLAVSGSHFSAYLMIISFFLNRLKLSNRKKSILFVIFVVLIGFMTGWSESVTRAAVMSVCILYSRDSYSGMAFSAIVMILSNPYSVFSDGFRMSFVSCIAIKTFSKPMNHRLKSVLKNKFARDLIVITLCAQIGMIAFAFGNQTRYGIPQFIAQIVSSVLIEIICVMFIAGIILYPVIRSAFVPVGLLSSILEKVMSFLAQKFDLSVCLSDYGSVIPWLFLTIIILCFMYRKRFLKSDIWKWITGLLILSMVATIVAAILTRPRTKIVFLDVGQGDSCLILTDRFNCLIDTGTEESGYQVIIDALDYYSISKLDMAIMTHWDEDHGGAMVKLLNECRVGRIYTSYVGLNDKTELFLKNHDVTDCNNFIQNVSRLVVNEKISLSDSDNLYVLWPYEVSSGENEDSLVMLLDCSGTTLLFTGDIDYACEEELIRMDKLPNIDILKVAHHGSKYSSSKEFLEATKPIDAIISVGEFNNYGHPSPEVLARLGEVEANISDTSQNGAVIVKILNNSYQVESFKENRNDF